MTMIFRLLALIVFVSSCKPTMTYYDDIKKDGGYKRQKMIRKYNKRNQRLMNKARNI